MRVIIILYQDTTIWISFTQVSWYLNLPGITIVIQQKSTVRS